MERDSRDRGWVPARYLHRSGPSAVALRRYDTTTLTPSQNAVLTLIEADAESGWLWCRDEEGDEGWFPTNRLEPSF